MWPFMPSGGSHDDKGLIEATRIYLRNMIRRAKDPKFLSMPIKTVIGESVAKGWVTLWEPYRHVHDVNRKRLHDLYKDRALPVVPDWGGVSAVMP
jgi:cyclase